MVKRPMEKSKEIGTPYEEFILKPLLLEAGMYVLKHPEEFRAWKERRKRKDAMKRRQGEEYEELYS